MSQSAISNRLNSNFGRVKDKELDLHTKLSIQAKQNALPKGNFITITSGLGFNTSDFEIDFKIFEI